MNTRGESPNINPDDMALDVGREVLHKRYEAIRHVIDILHTRLSAEEKVHAIGETLRPLLPFDRFCLGLLWLSKWYVMDEKGVFEARVKYTKDMPADFSASRWSMRTQKICVRNDLTQEAQFPYDEKLLKKGFLSDLSVPLISDGHTVGVFNFNCRDKNAYGGAEVVRAKSVASAAAALIKLFQDQLFFDGIREISEAVQGSIDLDHILQMVLDHIQSQGYDRVRVYLYDDNKKELVGVAQAGAETIQSFKSLRLPLDQDPYSQKTFLGRTAQIHVSEEMGIGLRGHMRQIFGDLEYQECADLPLFVGEEGKDRVVGKITIDNGLSDRPLLPERMDALMVYASQVAIAIRHAQLYQRLEQEVEDRTLQLRDSEERFRRLAEASFEGVVMTENGIILDVNDQYCHMLGYERTDLLNKPVLSFVAPQLHERVKHYIEINYDDPFESIMVSKSGNLIPIEVRARTVPYDGRMVRVAAIRDISDRKVIEQEQIRSERINAIGELAEGVAHNFNNLLVGMLGNAQLIQLRSQDEAVLADANLIVESALRAKKLVQQLQVSIQGDREYSLEVDVNNAIQMAVDVTRPRWKDQSEANGITIDVDLQLGNVQPIWGASDRLRDIVVNLILNGVEAMPNGGVLTIETKMDGEQVQMVFSDTGVGMQEETRRRVFDPFFTTKLNVGSGLGLSIVQGTVKSWGGNVAVESVVGKGTTFVLTLPSYKSQGTNNV